LQQVAVHQHLQAASSKSWAALGDGATGTFHESRSQQQCKAEPASTIIVSYHGSVRRAITHGRISNANATTSDKKEEVIRGVKP